MLEAVQTLIEDAVDRRDIPGAVAIVGDSDDWRLLAACGVLAYQPDDTKQNTVRRESCYDLASLTKVVATLPSVLELISRGEVRVEDRLERFFSNAGWMQTPSLADVTVAQLLGHHAGLPAWLPLFTTPHTALTALGTLLQSPRPNIGHCAYSDVGFMLLGSLVERVSGQTLAAFVREHVLTPLDMTMTEYGPVSPDNVAATEDCGWRGRVLRGEVHDENAFTLGSVAGHAGLFGTADDLARYAQAWLRFDLPFASPDLARACLRPQGICKVAGRRGLGWQLHGDPCFAGQEASETSFGHSGFTGTSVWIDPAQDWFVVLLTNRVHPSRYGGKAIQRLRREVHEEVARARRDR